MRDGPTAPPSFTCKRVATLVAACLAGVLTTCQNADPPAPTGLTGPGGDLFMEVTDAAGIDHVYTFPPEVADARTLTNLGGGAIAEDLDEDGLIDLYVANAFGPKKLYWNVGGGRFEEAAKASGLEFPDDWTIGLGAADIDNDGDQDLYLVNRREDRLIRNDGGRRFTEITAAAGIVGDRAGLGAQFADLDRDGRLDIFVSGTQLGTGEIVRASDIKELLDWGLAMSTIYRSRPDGTYEDVAHRIGPTGLPECNPFIGAMVDMDGDFDVDLYLIQDTQGRVKNLLYENLGPGEDGFPTFRNVSASCGCEQPWAAMGLGMLDYDSNGLPDFFVTNVYSSPPNREALLLNRGGMVFQDVSDFNGASTMDPWYEGGPRAVSWGAVSLDVENDSIADLFVVYGQLEMDLGSSSFDSYNPEMSPGQPDALLRGGVDGKFTLAPASGLEDVARGHAALVADFDEDGCEDLFVVNLEAPSKLYRNRCNSGYRWVGFELEGTVSNRDAIGARVKVETGGRVQWGFVTGCTTSVHSCNPKRLHFGIGGADVVDKATIYWPSGTVQTLEGLSSGRRHHVLEPKDTVAARVNGL